jgi:hypothetical protein
MAWVTVEEFLEGSCVGAASTAGNTPYTTSSSSSSDVTEWITAEGIAGGKQLDPDQQQQQQHMYSLYANAHTHVAAADAGQRAAAGYKVVTAVWLPYGNDVRELFWSYKVALRHVNSHALVNAAMWMRFQEASSVDHSSTSSSSSKTSAGVGSSTFAGRAVASARLFVGFPPEAPAAAAVANTAADMSAAAVANTAADMSAAAVANTAADMSAAAVEANAGAGGTKECGYEEASAAAAAGMLAVGAAACTAAAAAAGGAAVTKERGDEEAWRVMRLPPVEQQLQGRAVDVQVRLQQVACLSCQPAFEEQQHIVTYGDHMQWLVVHHKVARALAVDHFMTAAASLIVQWFCQMVSIRWHSSGAAAAGPGNRRAGEAAVGRLPEEPQHFVTYGDIW